MSAGTSYFLGLLFLFSITEIIGDVENTCGANISSLEILSSKHKALATCLFLGDIIVWA
jgi:hypothetical protein